MSVRRLNRILGGDGGGLISTVNTESRCCWRLRFRKRRQEGFTLAALDLIFLILAFIEAAAFRFLAQIATPMIALLGRILISSVRS